MTEKEWRQWIRDKVRGSTRLLWVLDGKLACSPRPLRYHPQVGGRVSLHCEVADILNAYTRIVAQDRMAELLAFNPVQRYGLLRKGDIAVGRAVGPARGRYIRRPA